MTSQDDSIRLHMEYVRIVHVIVYVITSHNCVSLYTTDENRDRHDAFLL